MFNNEDWNELKWEQFCRFNDLLDNNDNSEWRNTFTKLVDVIETSGHTSIY